MIIAIDHVQLAMPPGGEDVAEAFYSGALGLTRVRKPPALARRGGCWFEHGPVHVHLGAEESFTPAKKAHPAFVVADLKGFVRDHALDVVWSDEVPGTVRCHLQDPFGNRLELVDATSS
jgi:catechol 2,3-dioxygenase-like lactoylglutathione lyase family enzyme